MKYLFVLMLAFYLSVGGGFAQSQRQIFTCYQHQQYLELSIRLMGAANQWGNDGRYFYDNNCTGLATTMVNNAIVAANTVFEAKVICASMGGNYGGTYVNAGWIVPMNWHICSR